ncbi:MAG TPA: DUF4430 domain-containing protein [Solirubrobacter sp.]|nr:DUF4430 domain-containing protein [Solirubrobacter sp.]
MRRLALIACLALLSGCGLGAGEETGGPVTLTVSHGFGSEHVAPPVEGNAREGETVMRLLQRSFDVSTRFGGNFVQEIEGIAGGRENGRRVDWFYYVNGIEASIGAGEKRLYPGDRVWFDHHDWEEAMRVPAVVGAFPEPFKSGVDGKKLPIRLVCLGPETRSCDEVETRLKTAGVRNIARSNLESSPGEVLRVLVGRWRDVRKDITARRLEEGPAASGVFARPAPSGERIDLMGPDGEVERTLGAAAGLVAATAVVEERPTWLISGTDDVGVAAAAAALTEDQLRDHFAVAIEAGRGVPLPIEGP